MIVVFILIYEFSKKYNLLVWGKCHKTIIQAPKISIEKTNLSMLANNLNMLINCNRGFPDLKIFFKNPKN